MTKFVGGMRLSNRLDSEINVLNKRLCGSIYIFRVRLSAVFDTTLRACLKKMDFHCWFVRLFTIPMTGDGATMMVWLLSRGLFSVVVLLYERIVLLCSVFGKNEKRGIRRGDKMGSFISCCVPVLCCFCSILYSLTNKDPWHLTKVVVWCICR